MFETPCAVSADERNHDAGYADRCQHADAVESAKQTFIAGHVSELVTTDRFDCFIEQEGGQEQILNAIANAEDFSAARRQMDDYIKAGAKLIAERMWRDREAVVAFGIMEDMRNHGQSWWDGQ